MKNILNLTLLVFFAPIILTGCDKNDGGKTDLNDKEVALRMSSEGRIFGFQLMAEVLASETEQPNIVISPLSLNMALAMVWNGALGDTRKGIQTAMGMGDYPEEKVNSYFKDLRETLLAADPAVIVALANSIWADEGYPVKESFYDINRLWYNAQVSTLNFKDPAAPDIINRWCADNTNGLIDKIIDEIPESAVMYLLNALYFKGSWADGYAFDVEGTRDAYFMTEAGSQKMIKMMGQQSEQLYYEDSDLQLTSLPYGNGAFRMTLILPAVNQTVTSVVGKLKDSNYLNACLSGATKQEVNLFLPRFKTEYGVSLNDPLSAMGMALAFTDSADFSGISPIKSLISNVKQKACIEVDEEGSEAAAVTVVEIVATSVQPGPYIPTFRANRPFLFMIQEDTSGTILFMGKVGAP